MITYENDITVEDYNMLRSSVSWFVLDEEQAANGIRNTTFLLRAVYNNKTVGMARLISDGGYMALIADVIVMPEYQGQGIGKYMMKQILFYVKSGLKEGQTVYVNLMAAKGMERFYERFGFWLRPQEFTGSGMTIRIKPDVEKPYETM